MRLLLLFLVTTTSIIAPGLCSQYQEIIKSWRGVEGPPLDPGYRALSKRATAVEELQERGWKIVSILSYWWRVYIAKKGILTDYPGCGLRNSDATFSTTQFAYSVDATNECWWGCEWIANPFGDRDIWTFTEVDLAGISYTYTIYSVDPRFPADTCTAFSDRCLLGLSNRMQEIYFSYTALYNPIATALGAAPLPATIQQFCCVKFLDCTQGLPTNLAAQAVFANKVSSCYLFVIKSVGLLPNDIFYSRDHITMTISIILTAARIALLLPPPRKRSSMDLTKPQLKAVKSSLRSVVDSFGESTSGQQFPKTDAFPLLDLPSLNLTIQDNANQDRFFGAGSDLVFFNSDTKIRRYPWVCSLRTRGYRSYHKCGVTLLSGPPGPTILVSAAHCNFVCKDGNNLVENCCCRDPAQQTSCKTESHCGKNPELSNAEPEDLTIICGEHNTEVVPDGVNTKESEAVLEVLEVINHPLFSAGTGTPDDDGILEGYDISVYLVNDTSLRNPSFGLLRQENIWPICLPKGDDAYTLADGSPKRGVLSGWRDPQPTYLYSDLETIGTWRSFYYQRQVELEEIDCVDDNPVLDATVPWTNTYYPPKAKCFRDPTFASCVEFGVSGSGLMRDEASTDPPTYSFQGPVSFSRGCDLSLSLPVGAENRIFSRASNPIVFTDARCFMDWISAQYGMRMPDDYTKPASCKERVGTGDRADSNQEVCRGFQFDLNVRPITATCNWALTRTAYSLDKNQCVRYGDNKFVFNLYLCKDDLNRDLVCFNNCPGVNTDGIIIGGAVAAAAGGIAASGVVVPAAGSLLGVGAFGMMTMQCVQNGGCILRGRCCSRVVVRGRRTRCRCNNG